MVHEEPKKPRKTLLDRLRERSEAKRVKKAQPAQPIEVAAAPDDALALSLPEDHPIILLWRRTHELPPPRFSLEAPPPLPAPDQGSSPPLVPEETVEQELYRLGQLAFQSAERRLAILELETEQDNAAPDVDTEVHVFMTAQHVTAWVFAYPPSGAGRALDRGMLHDALQSAKISYGIDESLLDRLPGLPDRYFHLFLIATGDPPLHGQDGYVNDHFSRSPPKPFEMNANGVVDFSSIELFQNAKRGDVICDIFPPTPCRDGKSVRGDIAYARGGQLATVPRGRNTELTEDGTQLIATCEGHVEFSGHRFQVKPTTDLTGDVDATSGNVSSLGDVHIHGDVRSGYSVRATGSITVDGVIESATVEAGGDLVVRKGVQGNGQAVLRAHRNVYVRYMESCSVYARQDVNAECIINCDIFSDGRVTARSGRGKIMGGKIRAAEQVSAIIVGARSEMPTTIVLGGKPFEDFERELLERELQELEREIAKLDHRRAGPEQQQQVSKLRLQVAANQMKLGELSKLSGTAPGGSARLICDTVHPGVEIKIGKASRKVVCETNMCDAALHGDFIDLK